MTHYFSKRSGWPTGENALAAALRVRRAGGGRVLDLSESNPTRAGCSPEGVDVLAALRDPAGLLYEPQARGLERARAAVREYYRCKQVNVPLERLCLTASTSEAYSFLFRLLAEPGDKVLIPAPSYPLFSYLADVSDVRVEHYQIRLENDVWRINFESLEQALDGRVRAVVLVSPNNPTGSCIKRDELAQLNRLCAAHGVAIISDEVFADYLFAGHEKDMVTLAGNAPVLSFALGGLSKALAMPQMKLAWIAANGPADELTEAMARLEIIADTFLSVNTPVQHAVPVWLAEAEKFQHPVRERVRINYDYLCKTAGARALDIEGGWYGLLRSKVPVDESFAVLLLNEEGVYFHPGYYFDFPDDGYAVVSLLARPEDFREGIIRLLKRTA